MREVCGVWGAGIQEFQHHWASMQSHLKNIVGKKFKKIKMKLEYLRYSSATVGENKPVISSHDAIRKSIQAIPEQSAVP